MSILIHGDPDEKQCISTCIYNLFIIKDRRKMEKWVEMMEKETEQEANWQDIYSWTTRSHHEEELKLCVHCFLKTLRFQLP